MKKKEIHVGCLYDLIAKYRKDFQETEQKQNRVGVFLFLKILMIFITHKKMKMKELV